MGGTCSPPTTAGPESPALTTQDHLSLPIDLSFEERNLFFFFFFPNPGKKFSKYIALNFYDL